MRGTQRAVKMVRQYNRLDDVATIGRIFPGQVFRIESWPIGEFERKITFYVGLSPIVWKRLCVTANLILEASELVVFIQLSVNTRICDDQ